MSQTLNVYISGLCCHRSVAVSTNCQLACFIFTFPEKPLQRPALLAGSSRRYLRQHDVLPSSAQRDAEEVVHCRSILEADSSVILLVRGSADHCVPVCLGTDTNGASDHKRARENRLLHRKFHPLFLTFYLKPP